MFKLSNANIRILPCVCSSRRGNDFDVSAQSVYRASLFWECNPDIGVLSVNLIGFALPCPDKPETGCHVGVHDPTPIPS